MGPGRGRSRRMDNVSVLLARRDTDGPQEAGQEPSHLWRLRHKYVSTTNVCKLCCIKSRERIRFPSPLLLVFYIMKDFFVNFLFTSGDPEQAAEQYLSNLWRRFDPVDPPPPQGPSLLPYLHFQLKSLL